MFTAGERLERSELAARHARCRTVLRAVLPEAEGLLVTGNPALYYFTGSMVTGVFWLPLDEREPVLAVRKGIERARLESPLESICAYRGFRELPKIFAEAGAPLADVIAVDKNGFDWRSADLLQSALPGRRFLAGDDAILRTRAIKSEWELRRLRETGERHHQALRRMLPLRIRPGQSEYAIGRELWEVFFELGHSGPAPTGMQGPALFLGAVSAGENGNYPSAYNGPVGVKGVHPTAPTLGHMQEVWKKGELLTIDIALNYQGYLTDKTQVYFAGPAETIPAPVRAAQEATEAIEAMAAGLLRPGVSPAAVYAESLRMARDFDFAEGFMGLGGNQVPFLGHAIGLTVSEWPIIARQFTDPIQPGMVIALEPKIGLPDYGMVGTENTYEVTEDGARCLTGGERGIVAIA